MNSHKATLWNETLRNMKTGLETVDIHALVSPLGLNREYLRGKRLQGC